MPAKFHFISGLPRSESTLLSTILRQNTPFPAGMTSPVGSLFTARAGSLLIVECELLAQAPEKAPRLIYDFVGEPWFEHDFKNELDQALGLSGLHRVRPKVTHEPRQTILPPDLFEQYSKLSFWHGGRGSSAHVIRATPTHSNNSAPKTSAVG